MFTAAPFERAARPKKGADRRLLIGGAAALVVVIAGFGVWKTGLLGSGSGGGGDDDSAMAVYEWDLIPAAYGGKCGYVDGKGKIVINPQFDDGLPFVRSTGQAPVAFGGKWGLIDAKGAYVVNPQFERLELSADSKTYRVRLGGKWGVIDAKGEFVINPQYEGLSDFDERGRAVVALGGKWGIINRKGDFVVPPQFDLIQAAPTADGFAIFSEGMAVARSGGKYGYIDESGAWKINPQFSEANGFGEEGLASVTAVTFEEQVDENAKARNEARATAAAQYDAYIARNQFYFRPSPPPGYGMPPEPTMVKVEKRQDGYIDKTGAIVIKPQFDTAGYFRHGLAPVRMQSVWGFIDPKGAFKINPQFSRPGIFTDTPEGPMAVVGVPREGDTDAVGLIDTKGVYKIRPQFDYMTIIERLGRGIVRSDAKYGLVDLTGRFLAPPIYDQLTYLGNGRFLYRQAAGATAAGPEFGFMSKDGKVLTTLRAEECGR